MSLTRVLWSLKATLEFCDHSYQVVLELSWWLKSNSLKIFLYIYRNLRLMQQPNEEKGGLMHEVCRSHTVTHHSL